MYPIRTANEPSTTILHQKRVKECKISTGMKTHSSFTTNNSLEIAQAAAPVPRVMNPVYIFISFRDKIRLRVDKYLPWKTMLFPGSASINAAARPLGSG